MPDKATQKYLSLYAEFANIVEQDTAALESRDYALVIPAYKEHFDFVKLLTQHEHAHKILLILVLNEPDNDRGNAKNRSFLGDLNHHAEHIHTFSNIDFYRYESLQIACIQRLEDQAIPKNLGVGMARKLGADLACHLWAKKKISCPWIFSSDADAQLAAKHFDLPFADNVSAYCYPFKHVGPDGPVLAATQVYEKCLHYYQRQLELAGSPYAFHSLGSCMAISMPYYCRARGFPKRAGGEDFYLLNKLAKLAEVRTLHPQEVRIEARVSDRVPFGTGPAVARILDDQAHQRPTLYYSPHIFEELRALLNAVPRFWSDLDSAQASLPPICWQALIDAGFEQFLAKRRVQDKNSQQFCQHFHHWFDGFQTLKFIHRLQSSYPDQAIEAIAGACVEQS